MVLEGSNDQIYETIVDSFKYWKINIELGDENGVDV